MQLHVLRNTREDHLSGAFFQFMTSFKANVWSSGWRRGCCCGAVTHRTCGHTVPAYGFGLVPLWAKLQRGQQLSVHVVIYCKHIWFVSLSQNYAKGLYAKMPKLCPAHLGWIVNEILFGCTVTFLLRLFGSGCSGLVCMCVSSSQCGSGNPHKISKEMFLSHLGGVCIPACASADSLLSW